MVPVDWYTAAKRNLEPPIGDSRSLAGLADAEQLHCEVRVRANCVFAPSRELYIHGLKHRNVADSVGRTHNGSDRVL